MQLSDGILVLRTAALTDAEQLNAWWNDGRVMEHAGFPDGLGQSLEQTQEEITAWEGRKGALLIIEVDDQPVGECNYHILNEHTASCGWKICEPVQQNKGYGTRLIKLLLNHLFFNPQVQDVAPINRVVWDTNIDNLRAQHAYEQKIGARRVKENINAWKDQRGQWQSSVDYEVLKTDFMMK